VDGRLGIPADPLAVLPVKFREALQCVDAEGVVPGEAGGHLGVPAVQQEVDDLVIEVVFARQPPLLVGGAVSHDAQRVAGWWGRAHPGSDVVATFGRAW